MKKTRSRLKHLFLSLVLFSVSFFATSTILAAKNTNSQKRYTPNQIRNMEAPSSNPWLSMMSKGSETDWGYWNMKRAMGSADRMKSVKPAASTTTLSNNNLLPFTALPQFGTGSLQNGSLEIKGEFLLPDPIRVSPDPEDEGSILLATELTPLVSGNAVVIDAVIGDGNFGSAGTGSGDNDYYAIRNLKAGQEIFVDLDGTQPPSGPDFFGFEATAVVYNSKGDAVDFGIRSVLDRVTLRYTVEEDGDFFIAIFETAGGELEDPFDSASGNGIFEGQPLPLNEGPYSVTIGLDYFVLKDFVFTLSPGDIFGASIMENGDRLTLIDPVSRTRQESTVDLSFILPDSSPLPAGMVSVNHVADELGMFMLSVRSLLAGPFTLRLEAAIPPLSSGRAEQTQIIFVDFDGATVDLSESVSSNSVPGTQIKTLSPLSTFLPRWGLTDEDEDTVIDKIMSVLEESLVEDIKRNGGNLDFDIKLLNSRDHDDPFGKENVSRVIVGGTVAELGINTLGIAQSIDIGNFDTSETAFVLLDTLSDPQTTVPDSLNGVPRAEGVSIMDVIAVGVGEIIAHEAGHYLGNWHTDERNSVRNVMDRGGLLRRNILGIGADNIFGTADDENVSFGSDIYSRAEGLIGTENTLTATEWGSSGDLLDDNIDN